MLAALRPDSFDLPLFLHVFGATVLFGATATIAIAGYASRRSPGNSALLARVVVGTWLLGILPAFILMRAGAALIVDKEFPDGADTPGWVGVGFIVSEPGALLLIIVGILGVDLHPQGPRRSSRCRSSRASTCSRSPSPGSR